MCVTRLPLIACLLAVPLTVHAEELRLPYTAETKPIAMQTHPVGSDTGHVLGVAAFDGTARVDGEDAQHGYAGQIELTDGAGTIRGYAHWSFDDGSSITARYEGIVYAASDNSKIDFEATWQEVQGSGRYDGASGSGVFSGKRIEGGKTRIAGELNLTVPD